MRQNADAAAEIGAAPAHRRHVFDQHLGAGIDAVPAEHAGLRPDAEIAEQACRIEIDRLKAERGSTIGADQIYPNALKRVSLRTNLTSQFTSKSDLAITIGYVDSYIRQPQNEDNSDGLMVDALGGAARTDLVDARGIPLRGYRAPFLMGDIFAQRNAQSVNRFINGLNARYYPTAWLNMRVNVGYDYASRNETFLQERDQGPFGDTNRNATNNGFVQSVRSENAVYTVDGGATATWNPLARWSAKTSFGAQYFRNWASRTQGTGQTLPPGGTTTTAGAIRASTQNTAEAINLGGFGEEVLSWADRVFITGGIRYDGNSAFGSNFSGVFYPKVGASWLLSDESFFPKIEALNSFRLRATYGSSGVQPGTADALRYFTPVGASILGVEQSAVTLGSLGNTKLKPEYSGEFETGFDLTAFRNATLQGAYVLMAARAIGLDCGPMSGFDQAGVDAAFFAGTAVKSNFLINIGHGDAGRNLFPRSPRLSFDEACTIA